MYILIYMYAVTFLTIHEYLLKIKENEKSHPFNEWHSVKVWTGVEQPLETVGQIKVGAVIVAVHL